VASTPGITAPTIALAVGGIASSFLTEMLTTVGSRLRMSSDLLAPASSSASAGKAAVQASMTTIAAAEKIWGKEALYTSIVLCPPAV
jgi:hypothetical protein